MCTWRKLTHLSQSSCNPEWNKHARSFWFYSFSSCAISLLGLTLFMTSWRFTAFFIVFQSFVSYCADVHHCGRPSIFHGIDHWAAVGTGSLFANFLIFSVNECISSHQKVRAASLVAVAACLGALALASKTFSMRAQHRQDMWSYFTYHACWHYIIASCCVLPLLSCAESEESDVMF